LSGNLLVSKLVLIDGTICHEIIGIRSWNETVIMSQVVS
jgi:hypothetical protein